MFDVVYQKELTLMEHLSIAMHILLANFKEILKVIFILFLPISILNVLIVGRLGDSALHLAQMSETMGLGSTNEFMQMSVVYFGNVLLQATVLLFLEPVGIIAVAKIGKSYVEGNPISVGEAMGEGLGSLTKIIGAGIPFWLGIVIGTLLFIVPGIYLSIIWVLYVYAIGLRGEKGIGALRYSSSLVKGRWWGTFLGIVVVSMMSYAINWIFSGLMIFGADSIAIQVLYSTLCYISGAFGYLFLTIMFLNREAVIFGRQRDVVAVNEVV